MRFTKRLHGGSETRSFLVINRSKFFLSNLFLLEAISSTISRNGNVLLPVDSAGRVLELLLTLDQHWTASRPNAPLILCVNQLFYLFWRLFAPSLSHTAFNTAENARGHLEWMSDAVLKRFVTNRDNAFAFRHVNIAHDIEELKVQFISRHLRFLICAGVTLTARCLGYVGITRAFLCARSLYSVGS